MSEDDYKELNSYLNDLFLYLDKNYKLILENMLDIFIINDEYYKRIGNYDLDYDIKQNKLTFQEVYDYARKIIKSISADYLYLYDDLIETGKLDFSYNNEYFDSHFTHCGDINLININREFNYFDVILLIHEFFHYTNCSAGRNYKNDILTEFISIYFETYAINYLINDGIPKDEIDYNGRINWTFARSYELYYIETPLMAYNNFGNLNEDSLNLLNQFFTKGLKANTYHRDCKCLLQYFRNKKEEYTEKKFSNEIDNRELQIEYSKLIINHFRYFFGTMWAFYAIENCDMEDILYVNNHIYDENISLEDCFNKMKIDVYDYEIFEEAFEVIDEYLNIFNEKRK